MSGFELPVLIAAGSAAAPFCQKLAKKIKKYLLKRAEKEVDERVFRKGEKAEFESGLRDLAEPRGRRRAFNIARVPDAKILSMIGCDTS